MVKMSTDGEEQKPGSSMKNPFDLTDDTEEPTVKTETASHSITPQAAFKPDNSTKFNWDDIEAHIDATALGERRTLILPMSGLKPRTRGTCEWSKLSLNTLHHQIETEMGSTFDVTKYELVWYDGSEDFALDKPGRYKIMLKRFSQSLSGRANVLRLSVQARSTPDDAIELRQEQTEIVGAVEPTVRGEGHLAKDAGDRHPESDNPAPPAKRQRTDEEQPDEVMTSSEETGNSNAQEGPNIEEDTTATAATREHVVKPAIGDRVFTTSVTWIPATENEVANASIARVGVLASATSTGQLLTHEQSPHEISPSETTASQAFAATAATVTISAKQILDPPTTETPSAETSALDAVQTEPTTPEKSTNATSTAEQALSQEQAPEATATTSSIPAESNIQRATPTAPAQEAVTSPPVTPASETTNGGSDESAPQPDHGIYDSDDDLSPAKYRQLNQSPNPRGISQRELTGLTEDLTHPADSLAVPADFTLTTDETDSVDGDDSEAESGSKADLVADSDSDSDSSSSSDDTTLSPADQAWRRMQKRRELARESKREEIADIKAEIAVLEGGGVNTANGVRLLREARSELQAMEIELGLLGG
ncbi:hypothetical protein OHC33_003815 [Knufia fluminis]|uniref:Uncharacterized protein n=1 Tax=Knufia fluminis TaxID=191047 RepID=A0AAN8FBE8_9EURO|nr:hypothetical protein OHC33_003815 [Knufia fluminis]